MEIKNDGLIEARERIFRKNHLESMLSELYKQKNELTEKCEKLRAVMKKEQADVEKLEGKTLSALFYGIFGNREEKLEKEEKEAFEAEIKYSLAANELAAVKDDINRCMSEIKTLSDCEKEYEKLFSEKAERIKFSGGVYAEKILKAEEKTAILKNRKREINEAIFAGKNAEKTVDEIKRSLDDAKSWGTFDVFGGGFLAAAAKHDALDSAQKLVERLRSELRRFKTELADVSVESDISVNIEGFLRFADYFFDGFFVDMTVLDKIEESMGKVNKTKNRIAKVLEKLYKMLSETESQISALENELSEIVISANT